MNAIGIIPSVSMEPPKIGGIGHIGGFGELGLETGLKPAAIPDHGFASFLDKAVGKVDGLQQGADNALTALASGKATDLHGTMIALEQADIALRAAVAVRDKFVAAYEAVMQMSI